MPQVLWLYGIRKFVSMLTRTRFFVNQSTHSHFFHQECSNYFIILLRSMSTSSKRSHFNISSYISQSFLHPWHTLSSSMLYIIKKYIFSCSSLCNFLYPLLYSVASFCICSSFCTGELGRSSFASDMSPAVDLL